MEGDEEQMAKYDILRKLAIQSARNNFALLQNYTIESSYLDMKREYELIKYIEEKKEREKQLRLIACGLDYIFSYIRKIYLKDMMHKYLGDVAKSMDYLFDDNFDKVRYQFEKLTGFYTCYTAKLTHLQRCTIMSIEYPALVDYLEEYIKDINLKLDTNDIGCNALHYAIVINTCGYNTTRLILLLKVGGIDTDQKNIYGKTPLDYAII